MDTFTDWLTEEMNTRGWTQAELSRRSSLSEAQISRIVSEKRGVGWDASHRIARALEVPPCRVFYLAGLIKNPHIIGDQYQNELLDYFEALSHENRELLVRFARLLYEQQTPQETGRTS